jgi:hypothetical protein
MCTENVKEKTELLYALINGRKVSDVPKISQVRISVYITTVLDVLTFCFVLREVWFYLQLNNMIVAYCVHLAAILDNLGGARPGLSFGTWPTAEEVCLFISVIN